MWQEFFHTILTAAEASVIPESEFSPDLGAYYWVVEIFTISLTKMDVREDFE